MRNSVTVSTKSHQNYNYRVSWSQGGKRKSKWFKRKKDAEDFGVTTRKVLADKGAEQGPVTPAELRAVHAFRELLSELPKHAKKSTLADAVEHFSAGLLKRNTSITCEVVADKLHAALKKAGRGKRHLQSIEQRMKRFNQDYADWLACDITTEIIEDFLNNLPEKSVPHYRQSIGQMFNHAIKLKATPSNPVTDTLKPKIKPTSTGILTPAQLAKLLASADDATLPGLAISFFAGVRRAEIERLDWSEVDLSEGFIEITAANAKTAQRRLIPISDNLKAWLTPYAQHEGALIKSPAIWRNGQESARKTANLKNWPHNAGRHSFASYHLALHEDPGKLAMALGHPDPRLLFKHYRQLVTVKAAKTFWGITPADSSDITHIKSA